MTRQILLWKSIGIALGVGVVALGGGYLWAYLDGRGTVATLQESLAGKDQELERLAAVHQEELRRLEARLALLRAERQVFAVRGRLESAIGALDAMNFGVAQETLRTCGETLAGLPCGDVFRSVVNDLRTFEVPISADISATKKIVRHHLQRLDTLLLVPDDWVHLCIAADLQAAAEVGSETQQRR